MKLGIAYLYNEGCKCVKACAVETMGMAERNDGGVYIVLYKRTKQFMVKPDQ